MKDTEEDSFAGPLGLKGVQYEDLPFTSQDLDQLDDTALHYAPMLERMNEWDMQVFVEALCVARHQCASVFGFVAPSPKDMAKVAFRMVFTGRLVFLVPTNLPNLDPCVWLPRDTDPHTDIPACLAMLCKYAPSTACIHLLKATDERRCVHCDVPRYPRLPQEDTTEFRVLNTGRKVQWLLERCSKPLPAGK